MARVLWDRPENPQAYVSRAFGIERWQLRNAIHRCKDRSNLGGGDRVNHLR